VICNCGKFSRIRHRPKFRRRGAILIEVLLALTILATGIAAIAQGLSTNLRAAGSAHKQSLAARLAQAKLDEIQAQGLARIEETAGDFGPANPNMRWTVEARDADRSGLKQLTLTVTWSVRRRPYQASYARLVFEPTEDERAIGGAM